MVKTNLQKMLGKFIMYVKGTGSTRLIVIVLYFSSGNGGNML